jgi:hypothetical protein
VVEYPKLDDANFLAHTIVYRTEALPWIARPGCNHKVAAHGKEVLMNSLKSPRDLRGPQWRIGRLLGFYLEAFIHMLTYRIMVPLTILFGALMLLSLFLQRLGPALKIFTAVIWVLWTPQLFAVAKGLSLAWTRGMAFGRLNEEFAHLYKKRYGKKTAAFVAFPFIVLVVWAAGFVVMLVWWQP